MRLHLCYNYLLKTDSKKYEILKGKISGKRSINIRNYDFFGFVRDRTRKSAITITIKSQLFA